MLQANIKEPQFGLDFFKGFDIVLNGLDNLEARRHVNRLCLASRTPLVESGTAGYLGQVKGCSDIKPGSLPLIANTALARAMRLSRTSTKLSSLTQLSVGQPHFWGL